MITAQFKLSYVDFELSVDVSLPDTGISVLFGHSGSGKTTLLRCVAGLQKAEQGYLVVNGKVWQDSKNGIFLPTYQRSLGYVFQEANLFAHLNVRDNLHYGLKRTKTPFDNTQFNHIVELLGIAHLMDRMPVHLSGGEKQRVGIARALVLNPDILLMDEPLASLDFKRKQEILPFLRCLNQELNIPVLYVTHSQQEVAQLADYLIVMAQGKVQAVGLLAETLTRLDLPLAQQNDAITVWNVTVMAHESEFALTHVSFETQILYLPAIDAPINTALRIQIHARDVSIALQQPKAVSILNILPAVIVEMTEGEIGQITLRLKIANQFLLAHITRKSALALNLKSGTNVFAQIKGVSILN